MYLLPRSVSGRGPSISMATRSIGSPLLYSSKGDFCFALGPLIEAQRLHLQHHSSKSRRQWIQSHLWRTLPRVLDSPKGPPTGLSWCNFSTLARSAVWTASCHISSPSSGDSHRWYNTRSLRKRESHNAQYASVTRQDGQRRATLVSICSGVRWLSSSRFLLISPVSPPQECWSYTAALWRHYWAFRWGKRHLPCYLGHPHGILSPLDASSERNLSPNRVAATMLLHFDESFLLDMQNRNHSSAVFPVTLPIVPSSSWMKAAIVKRHGQFSQ